MLMLKSHPLFFSEQVGLSVIPLRNIRLKVTDKCPWNCCWCHNEGSGGRNPKLVGDMEWNSELSEVLESFKNDLGVDQIHLTGGEPTSHPDLPNLIANFKQAGFYVKATSIGCEKTRLKAIIDSGLNGINFSFHALDAGLLYSTQVNRGLAWAEKQLLQQSEAILLAKESGIEVKLNTVVVSHQDYSRVISVIEWVQQNHIPVRLMNELNNDLESTKAILELCKFIGAVEVGRQYIYGSSSYTILYRLPNGYLFGAKLIHGVYLKTICSKCSLRDKGQCKEKFYGIRLEKRLIADEWGLYVRLCLHRTDADTYLPAKDFFLSKHLREIRTLITQEETYAYSSKASYNPI